MSDSIAPSRNAVGEYFGAWLKVRAGDAGDIGRLAAIVAGDRRVRNDATPTDVRNLLSGDGAEGDMFEALDEAATQWLDN